MKKAALILMILGLLLTGWGSGGLIMAEKRLAEGRPARRSSMATKAITKSPFEMIFDAELWDHPATRPVYRNILGSGVTISLAGLTLALLGRRRPGGRIMDESQIASGRL